MTVAFGDDPIRDVLDICDKIEANVQDCIDEIEKGDSANLVYLFLFIKFIKTLRAFCLLLRENYVNEASILLRTNYECFVEWNYFNKYQKIDPSQYLDQLKIQHLKRKERQNNRLSKSFKGACNSSCDIDIKKLVKEYCERYSIGKDGGYRFPEHWSGKTFFSRANGENFGELYELYRHLCQIAHRGSGCVSLYLHASSDNKTVFNEDIPQGYVNLLIYFACIMCLLFLGMANDVFMLDYADSIDSVIAKLENWRKSLGVLGDCS